MGETFPILEKNRPVVFFDGMCNLCNGFVQFIIKNDPEKVLYFSPLQSVAGENLHTLFPALKLCDSVIFYHRGKAVIKSEAALQILAMLPSWRWTRLFRLFPIRFRDWIYGFIAKNRFKLFGKRDSCMIPTDAIKSRFIS